VAATERKVTGYTRSRLVHLLGTAAALAILLALRASIPLLWWGPVIAMFPLGWLIGRREWRRTVPRIDERNAVVLYQADSLYYVALVAVFFADEAALVLLVGQIWFISEYPFLGWVVVWMLAMLIAGRNAALYRNVRRYEQAHGALAPRWFYQRSVTGPEGLIDRTGTVIEDCAPDGLVRIESIRWNARSVTGETLPRGTAVVVRDIEGLRLVVARKKEKYR
jgi:membrane protein implicated in regulation of membrane protease activity